SIKSLRKFANDRLTVPTADALQAELDGANDRSIVITMGAFVEDSLEHLLSRQMRPMEQEEYEEFFRHDGPVGSFSSKIQMAHGLKLTDKMTHRQLDVLREMRNACAHCKLPISFKTPELAAVCKRMLHPHGNFRLRADTQKGLREAFTA